MVKHAAWTLTRYARKADGQTSFFKLMSKDYHGEAAKFSELVWFRILAIKGSTFSARAQWNLESVKAVLVSPSELPVRTELDALLTRQKYITNQMLDQHGRTPLCTRCSLVTGSHSSDCRARFESTWTKELAEAEVPIRAEVEVANRAVDEVPIDPTVRVSEP